MEDFEYTWTMLQHFRGTIVRHPPSDEPPSSSWIQNSEMDSEGKTMTLPHTPKKVYNARIGQNPQCKVRAFKEPRLRRGKKSTTQRARHSSLVQGQCRSRLNKQGAESKSCKFLSYTPFSTLFIAAFDSFNIVHINFSRTRATKSYSRSLYVCSNQGTSRQRTNTFRGSIILLSNFKPTIRPSDSF